MDLFEVFEMTCVEEAINPTPRETDDGGGEQWKWEEITIGNKTKKKLYINFEIHHDGLIIQIKGNHIDESSVDGFSGPTIIIDKNSGKVSIGSGYPTGCHHFNPPTFQCCSCNLQCDHEYTYDNYCLFCGESGFESNITDIIDFITNYYTTENHGVSVVNTKQYNNKPTIRKLKTLIEDLKKDPYNTKNIIEIEKYIKKLK